MGDDDRVDTRALIDALGDWSAGEDPLYRQLAAALAGTIERGDLPPGSRLPPERAIAAGLPASRGTVVAAFTLLVDEGLVVRRQGSGTTVAGVARHDRPSLAAGLRAQALTGRALRSSTGSLALGLSVLDGPASLPAWALDVDASTMARAGRGHGYAPLGIDALRDRIADILTGRGLPTALEEVAITLGAQHGIALAAEVLSAVGTKAAVEDPSYPGAIDVFSRAGLDFEAIDTDGAGTIPASLRRALTSSDVGIVYLTPQCASPTGVVTVSSRRQELIDILDASEAWLVEDAALEFLAPPDGHGYLAAARPDRTVLVGTTSKVFWGGLRVGWLRAPIPVIERVGRLRASHDLGSPIAPQVTALRLLDELDDFARRRCDEATSRRVRLREQILRRAPDASIAMPAAGISLWIGGADGHRLSVAAATEGLDILAGSVCSVTGGQADRIRISAWAPVEVLDEAAERFAVAWKSVRSDD